ncbi:MAG: hypothetical protein AABM67_15470, partial [Acidobacteriota bacterium]
MSLIPKLLTATSVVLIVTSAGAISVWAQVQTAVGSYPTSTILRPDSTTEAKKSEPTKPTTATSESSAPDKTAALVQDTSKSDVVAVEGAPTTRAKSVTPEAATAPRPQAAPDDKWQFQFSPYFWLASLHGTTGTATRTAQVDESFSDIFHSLKFAFMGVLEARKNKLVVLTDLEYISIGDDRATPGPLFSAVDTKIKMFIFDPEVGYRVFQDPEKGQFIDVLGGVRVWHISTDLTFSPGILPGTQVQASRTWVDGIVGLRGKAAMSEKVFITGKFDLGGGGSKFTWQL